MTTMLNQGDYQRNWTAFHVFLHSSDQQEEFILGWLVPLAKDLLAAKAADAWFFTRYWDGGPHVRVRFLNLKPIDGLLAQFEQAASRFKTDKPFTAEEYYSGHTFDGEPVDKDNLSWHEDGEVRQYDYEPEFERYGGNTAITINEDLFYLSSEIAVAIMQAVKGSLEQRLQLSLKFIAVSLYVVSPTPEVLYHFARNYAGFWRVHASDVDTQKMGGAEPALLALLEQCRKDVVNGTLTGAVGAWANYMKAAIKKFRDVYEQGLLVSAMDGTQVTSQGAFDRAVISMVGSQIHMLNNRLAVTPSYEFVLCSRIRDALHQQFAAVYDTASSSAAGE